jgi:hypothetical protein
LFFSRYTPVPSHKIGDLIANSGSLRTLARDAQRLKDFEHLLFEALPPSLASASRVSNLKAGTLVVSTDNSAIAAKFRQLAPRLVSHLRKSGIEITGIQVDVQVKPRKIKAEEHVTPRGLPPEAIQEFSRLEQRLRASPLKAALARLAARRGSGRSR